MLEAIGTTIWKRGTTGVTPRLPASKPARRCALAPRRRRLGARLGQERGFTLIELLVASVAAIIVFSATLALLLSSQQVEARDSEWALTLQEDRAGLARMARDIRQATKVEEAKTSAIYFLATIGGKGWKIKYECGVSQSGTSYTKCVRLAAEEGNALPSTGPAVAKSLVSTTVFSYSPNTTSPTIATLKLELPAKGTLKQSGNSGYSHNVVLENAAFIRNLYLEG
jgi:type II secretory pathway pseudopilin PulG